jgi:Asp/Glu/hydantoin racemase
MKLLLVNPNTSESITAIIRDVATAAARPGTEIVAVTAKRGVPYIATRAEAAIGAVAALELLAEHAQGCDAAVIAAFGDPGLPAARELMPIPTVGLAEAGLFTACTLGRRFSIVSFSRALGPWFQECVEYHGLQTRSAGMRLLDSPFKDVASVQKEKEDLLVSMCEQAAKDDGADVAVLAGTPLAGLAQRIAHRVPIPLVDCVSASVLMAESLALQKPVLRPRNGKAATNIDPALAGLLAGS